MGKKKRGGKGNQGSSSGGRVRSVYLPVFMSWEIPVPVPGLGPSPVPLAVVPASELEVDYSKIEFLMRGVRLGEGDCMHMNMRYLLNDFYSITVEKNDGGEWEFVAKPWCKSQLNSLGLCSMFNVESRIYNISRLLLIDDVGQVPESLSFGGKSGSFACHRGVSWIDVKDHKKWNPGTPHNCYDLNLECAVLGHNIYCLQSGVVSVPKCYLTLENKWINCDDQPPHEILKCLVTKKMLAQPSNDCIIVHLTTFDYSTSYLYAWFHEPEPSWKLITQDIGFDMWNERHPTLAGDIIYFYDHMCPPYFSAFDLITEKWITVKWSANFPLDAAGYEADSMFYLGNRLLCLAKSCLIDILDPAGCICDVWGTRVTFSLFRFHTTYNLDDGPLVIFTHLFTKSLACPRIGEVADFISLVQDEVR